MQINSHLTVVETHCYAFSILKTFTKKYFESFSGFFSLFPYKQYQRDTPEDAA